MIHVYTFKEGLLAKLAHNLRLHVEDPHVERDGDCVAVSFHVNQLRVDGTIDRSGALNSTELTEANKADIQSNITREIFPQSSEVTFRGRIEGARLTGDLTLAGQTHPVVSDLKAGPNGLSGSLDLVPSAWGIEPYKTMGGAIRLKDHLRIEFSHPGEHP